MDFVEYREHPKERKEDYSMNMKKSGQSSLRDVGVPKRNAQQGTRAGNGGLRKWAIMPLVAAGLLLGTGAIATPAFAAQALSAGTDQDQSEALSHLNGVRAKAGLQPLQLNGVISKAASLHAAYYNANHGKKTEGAHNETKGMPGYTGATVTDRLKAAGWTFGSKGYSTGEVMHYKQASSKDAIDGWLDTAYHRKIILSPKYREVGFGLADGTAVADFAGFSEPGPIQGGISVYPYDGMTNVGVGFYGLESPNPLSQFNVDHSGYIISATTERDMVWHEAQIADESGAAVPYYEELYGGDTLFLYPKQILKGNHTYKISLSYQMKGTSGKLQKTWSFTTGKGHQLVSVQSRYSELVLNEGGELPIEAEGMYDDGVTEPLQTGVGYASSEPKGLAVSPGGMLKGVKPGDYTVTMTSGSVQNRIKVKVLPKLKLKEYPGTNPAAITDIAGHAGRSAIEWALRSGVMTASDRNQFRPDAAVTEAEFWTALLRMYRVDDEAYAPAKKTHWADGAYKAAADRNIPLAGIANKTARDRAITRQKAAEIIAAADGVNYPESQAVWYVLALDYVKGVTERSLEGFKGSEELTRGEAAELLKYLRPKLKELRGRPAAVTPSTALPPLPKREVYRKPDRLEDYMFVADFRAERTLALDGKFAGHAGETLKIMVQTGGERPQQIEDLHVTLDKDGVFHLAGAGPYNEDALNLYLVTPEAYYWIDVAAGSLNVSQYK